MFWQHGTLWIDTEDTDDLRIIKEVMEDEVLNQNLTVDFNLLKATETEPWDQWSMDIGEINGILDSYQRPNWGVR